MGQSTTGLRGSIMSRPNGQYDETDLRARVRARVKGGARGGVRVRVRVRAYEGTGPKISSREIVAWGGTSAKTVGRT